MMRRFWLRPAMFTRWLALAAASGPGLTLVLAACPSSALTGWQGGGPDAGWVTHLSRPFGAHGPLYAGTYGGGLFRSGDDGQTWVETSSNARDALIWDLERGEDGTLYAASEDRGVLRLDTGVTDIWFAANAGLNDPVQPFVYGMSTHPGDPLRVSAATSRGVFTSRSRGNLWPDSLKVINGVSVRDLLVLPELPNTIHAAGKEEFLIATGWIGLPTVIEPPKIQRNGSFVANTLFDLERWPGSTDSMLVVDFDGGLLQLQNRSQLVHLGPDLGNGPYARFYQAAVALDGAIPTIYVGADRGLYCTHNRGQLWQLYTGGLPNLKPEIWSVLVGGPVAGELLLGSFVHGVLRATGNADWQRSNSGLRAAWVRAVDAHAGELLVGTAHGSLHYGTDGSSWTDVTGALDDVQFSAVHLSRAGSAWLAAAFGGFYRSVDGGASWTEMSMPAGITRVDRFVESTGAGASAIYAATNDGLVASLDDGLSWQRVVGPPSGRPSFAMAVASGSAAMAIGFDPPIGVSLPPVLWVADAAGIWSEITLPVGFQGRIRGLSFLDATGSALAVASSPSGGSVIYRVSGLDGAAAPSFTSLEPGLGGRFVFPVDLTGDAAHDVLVLALDTDGLLVSADAGSTWSEWNDGLATLRAEQIALDAAPPPGMTSRLLLGTFARGAWIRESPQRVAVAIDGPWVERIADAVRIRARVLAPLRTRVVRESPSATTIVGQFESGVDIVVHESIEELRTLGTGPVSWVIEAELDAGWTELGRSRRELTDLVTALRTGLLPAAPNPFNPRTSIRWEQDRAGEVVVDLYDLRGRMVRRLIEGHAGPGRHTIPWDGTDAQNRSVASGTYVVQLRIDRRSWTERVTLLR